MDSQHTCLLYANAAERVAGLASVHREALETGHRSIHVTAGEPAHAFHDALERAGIDPGREQERGALRVLPASQVYLRGGDFDPDDTLAFWRDALDEALADGFSGLTASGDMSWAIDDDDALARLGPYENRLNEAVEDAELRVFCCYDSERFPPHGLGQALATHPRVRSGEGEPHSPAEQLAALFGRMRGAEKAVRNARAFQDQILELDSAGVYLCDEDGRITAFNEAASEIWGRRPVPGEPDERFCGSYRISLPDGSPLPTDQIPVSRVLRDGTRIENFEVVVERPDGSRVEVVADAAPLRDARGNISGTITMLVDVTQRHRAEEAQARLAAIVESADDAVISKDLDGIITSWNQGAERLFGYTPDEAVGRSVTMLIPPDRENEEPRILARIRRGERVETYETVRRRKDGSLVDISLTVSPVFDSEGRVIGASKVSRDITERKRAQEALREADRQKDEFLAMLSHELRNPLAPIRSSLELLRLGEPSARERAIEALERQAATLTRLVDDLVDVSRVTSGRVRIEKAELELNPIVRYAGESNRPIFQRKGQELAVSVPDEPIRVLGDATRLEQVLLNLLSNASRFTHEGGHVRLSLAREGDEAVLRVVDDGRGIEPERLPHVFELFTQGKRELDREEGGLGVGLALTRRLVRLHDGAMSANSEGRGRGSEFIVRLPALPEPAPSPEAARPEPAEDENGRPPLRVLYVEDFEDARDLGELVLDQLGYAVATAADGDGALEQMREFRPDVIMLDIGLPGMDGYEVARRVRANPDFRDVVLIAITGYAQQEHRLESEAAGFDHHLVKPVDYLGTVRELLEDVSRAPVPPADP